MYVCILLSMAQCAIKSLTQQRPLSLERPASKVSPWLASGTWILGESLLFPNWWWWLTVYGLCTQKYLVYAEHLSFWKSRVLLHARQDACVTLGIESLMGFLWLLHVVATSHCGRAELSCVTPLGKWSLELGPGFLPAPHWAHFPLLTLLGILSLW